MDYNSRQTRQRYIHANRGLQTSAHLHTLRYANKALQRPLWSTQMHFAIPRMHENTRKHTKQALCTEGKHGYTSRAGTMGGKQTQSRYCLGPISPGSPGGPCRTVRLHVCVWADRVSRMLSWHCCRWKELHFNSIMKKKRHRGGTSGSMLMLWCERTVTSAHTQQSGELDHSAPSESKRMGQEKGGCVGRTHKKHPPRIGREEEEAIGKQSQWGLISNSVNKCKPRVALQHKYITNHWNAPECNTSHTIVLSQ